ncbi:Glutathione S-transferase [Mycena venus]|uniref:glutathione transferase n=1 Tax=Mycena venus TaxID=2733690 RepID=A0A8H6XKE9_9AGAR|nr:Glutathione S-transferase [Mycena venus]
MTLKVHGHPQSTSTRRVLLILKEKKIPYELISIDWAVAQHKQPEWLQFHPFAQIPYIEDDGFVLYESRAIARYLVAAYPEEGPVLIPAAEAGVKAHALFEQAVAVEAFNFDPTVAAILTERLYKPFAGLTPDEAQVAVLVGQLETKLAGYERILTHSKYLTGEEVTLADLFHVPFLSLFGAGKIDVLTDEEKAKKWPNVVRYVHWLASRRYLIHIDRWANDLLEREASKSI